VENGTFWIGKEIQSNISSNNKEAQDHDYGLDYNALGNI
jgi:hypothetical protein